MLRTILAVIFVVFFLLSCLPAFGVEWLITKIAPQKKPASDLRQLRYVQWAFRVVLAISGVKVTYLGAENIPEEEPVLFTGNHRGIFDIIAAYSFMPHLTGFISKDDVLKVPILPFVMRRLYCLFLNRKDPREGLKTIIASFDYIKQGVSIFIFPEGTRNKNDDPAKLNMCHNGSFKAAQRTGCPVIPVAISGSDLILEKHFPRIKPGHVIVHFGPPVYYKDLSDKEKKNIGDHFGGILSRMLEEDKAKM